MKNTLLTLILILGGSLFLSLSQANEWPYGSSGFYQMDEEDDSEDGIPPEGESMPEMDEYENEDEDDDLYDSYEDEDSDEYRYFRDNDNSTWLDSDDE